MRLALVCFYCLCVFVYVLYFIATMSFAGYFLPVLFCMLSMLISDSRLIWFGSVYLVTTAGFVADQLMWENNNNNNNVQNIYVRMRELAVHTYNRNLFQNALADSKNNQPYTLYILVQQYTRLSVCLAIWFYFFMSNIRTYSTERCVDWHQNEEGSKHTSTCQGTRHRPFTVRTYICISYVYSSSVILLYSRRKKAQARGLLLMQRVSRYCCIYSQVCRPGPG